MTFKDWLATRRIFDTARGDFIQDARRDASFPGLATSWGAVLTYLTVERGACREAVSAARSLWRDYEARQRREGAAPYHEYRAARAEPGAPRSLTLLETWWLGLLQVGVVPLWCREPEASGVVVSVAPILRGLHKAAPRAKKENAITVGQFLRSVGCERLRTAKDRRWRFPPLLAARARWDIEYGPVQWAADRTDWG